MSAAHPYSSQRKPETDDDTASPRYQCSALARREVGQREIASRAEFIMHRAILCLAMDGIRAIFVVAVFEEG